MGIKLIEPCSENTEQISIPVNSQETSFSNRFDLKAIQSSTMANVSSSSSPRSVSSAVNSDNSLSPKLQVGGGENDVDDKSPILSGDFRELHVEKMERFKKYEDEYTTRLMAKYFSKKNIYGGNIFDENITIDDELIKSSRWPCTRSYADPVQAFEDHNSSDSASVSDTPLIISNGKHQPKKSG